MSRPFQLLALFSLLAAAPTRASAQAQADTAAPGQAVATDHRLSYAWLSVRADGVSPFFGVWGGTVDVAPCPWVSIGVTPAYVSRESGTGFAFDASLRLWPLGHGLDGLFLGAVGGVLRTSSNDAVTDAVEVGADAGWQLVWNGLSAAASLGGAWWGVLDGPAVGIEGPAARIRVELGWTWR